ncbi:hypothetical protein LCI18_011299 [Fusarium solani-melongenae]|uniref:Uncharacterized protein n=1 Tax=Fusarium solani subsp. cucurbitae TaxID=2747967 RepID=A0ACD3ZGE3_FUSSC|nr:hypothetical protein LCI18_011299 [Fusarium solani-melongenae]
MTDLLRAVPRDVLLLILEALPKADLKTLSQASSWLQDSVASTLWKSITIKSRGESHLHDLPTNSLPYRRLRTANRLHLWASFIRVTDNRCPHIYDYPRWMCSHDDEIHDEPQRALYFDDFADKVESLLDHMEPDQLQSFRALVPDHIQPLSVVLQNNSVHLNSLELDFANLLEIYSIGNSLDHDENDASDSSGDQDNGVSNTSSNTSDVENEKACRFKKPSFFASTMLGVDPNSPTLLFPRIRVLSLSLVPLTASMASVFNFDTLLSLKLRLCPRWEVFIECVLKLNRPIKLKTLEIQVDDNEDTILDLVDAFEGLEELFLSHTGPVPELQIWEILARRHTTLRRLIHPLGLRDLADLSIYGRDMRRIKGDPSKNPLAELHLEFVGLACIPGRMKYILLPFTSKTSLKAIHIRQTMSDISNFRSWALVDILPPLISRANDDASSDSDLTTYTEDSIPGSDWDFDFTQREPELRNEFCYFAEWAFGLDGIPSLDIIAFGDFAYGGRENDRNVLLGRNTSGTSNFRMLEAKAGEWKDALDKYHVAMGACPVDHLFTF